MLRLLLLMAMMMMMTMSCLPMTVLSHDLRHSLFVLRIYSGYHPDAFWAEEADRYMPPRPASPVKSIDSSSNEKKNHPICVGPSAGRGGPSSSAGKGDLRHLVEQMKSEMENQKVEMDRQKLEIDRLTKELRKADGSCNGKDVAATEECRRVGVEKAQG